MNPFDKLVPPGAPPKDGMNIAILSDFNIAGQPTFLMRAINKYTRHRARTIIWHDDYMRYDRDIVLDDPAHPGEKVSAEACEEARGIVEAADFYHFGRLVFNFPGVDFDQALTPRNCVVKYYGSELRNGWLEIAAWHRRTGIRAITGTDWTMVNRMPGFYHLGSYFTALGDLPTKDIPVSKQTVERPLVHAGSGTSGIKRYDVLQKAVEDLQGEGVAVDLQVLAGMANADALIEKAKCQICFTSLHQGWGISGVEAMWMAMPVLSAIDPFILSLYPDQPAIPIDAKNLKARLADLATSDSARWYWGNQAREFAEKNFRHRDIVRRYCRLLELIAGAELYAKGYGPAPRE